MQSLGFNVVRLGIEWQALEPGSGGPNQPKVCTPGSSREPARVQPGGGRALPEPRGRDRRAARPLRDLHPARHAPGRLQHELPWRGGAQLGRVHQQRADRAERAAVGRTTTANPTAPDGGPALLEPTTWWATSRATSISCGQPWRDYFKNNRWVVGYDPFNEPFSTETQIASESTFTGQLGVLLHGEGTTPASWPTGPTPLVCPSGRAERRCRPGDPGRRPPPPDLRGAGHLLGDRREHPVPAGPDAVPAPGLQFPRLLRRPQPRDRQSDQPAAAASSPRRRRRPSRTSPACP